MYLFKYQYIKFYHNFLLGKKKKGHIQCSSWIYPSYKQLWSSELLVALCVTLKTGECSSVQMCFMVHIQLEFLTITLLQDNTSAKINSLTGLCLDGVSMTLKWILPNTYSSHGVSVHALLITLSPLEMLGV